MTKPKSKRTAPVFDGRAIGVIVLDMAQELLIDALRQPNQLEVMSRRAEFVRRVNAAFAAQLAEQDRQDKAAAAGGERKKAVEAEKDAELLPGIRRCVEACKKDRVRVTADAIKQRASRLGIHELQGDECPTDRKINALKKQFLS